MKHLKPLNKKAKHLDEAAEKGQIEEVFQMSTFAGCTATLDPGWEVDPFGGVASLCQPMEADLYGCTQLCWWPAQTPDTMVSYPDFDAGGEAAMRDWRSLNPVGPKD